MADVEHAPKPYMHGSFLHRCSASAFHDDIKKDMAEDNRELDDRVCDGSSLDSCFQLEKFDK